MVVCGAVVFVGVLVYVCVCDNDHFVVLMRENCARLVCAGVCVLCVCE